MRAPIFGGFDVSRSPNASDAQCINLFPALIDGKQGKEIGTLYHTPGLVLRATAGNGPIQAMHYWPRTGQLWVVSGGSLYRILQDYQVDLIGSVGGTDKTCRGYSYSPNTGSLSAITLPFSTDGLGGPAVGDGNYWIEDNGAQLAVFCSTVPTQQDGFVLITQPLSNNFYQSNVNDVTTFNALNFGQAGGDPDNIVAPKQLKRYVWVIKQFNTELWSNIATPGFIFGRSDGVYLEVGTVSPKSVAQLGESLFWLSQNREGGRSFVMLQGTQDHRISTHSVEAELNTYSVVSDAIAWTQEMEGHKFYICAFPSANVTWAYDATDSAILGVHLWHKRMAFSNGVFNRHYGNQSAFFLGQTHVGDYRNGNIYTLDMNTFTDNGDQRKWLRTFRATAKPVDKPLRFDSLRIDMMTGIQVPDGTSPQMMMRFSDDGGHNWSNEKLAAVGQPGQTAMRVMFRRMGSTRTNTGLDRIYEISGTDQFPVAISGAVINEN
jgi:hypothetical protein